MAKLSVNFSVLEDALPSVVQTVMVQTATDIVDMAKQLAPVDTGALRASYMFSIEEMNPIHSKIIVGSLANIINPKSGTPATEYAFWVEFGTSNQAAQPHFVPAFMQARASYEARMKSALRKLGGK